MSKRETILARVLTVVTPTSGISSRAYRSRQIPLNNRSQLPAILIEPVSDDAEQNSSLPQLDWSLRIRITVLQIGDASTAADSAADSVVQSMHSLLMDDLTLNGNAIDIQPESVDYQFTDADQTTVAVNCDYLIRYRTSVDSLA
tara:strand:- start:7700 stop:8131 length:432 start_codon:yes stop_codon:yes gene_type:complete